jgi:hypothetical protein
MEREKDRTRENFGVRVDDIGWYCRDNHGQKVQAPSKYNVEINNQITVCKDFRDM